MDQAEYLLGDAKYVRDPWQGQFVKRDMNAVLETLAAALNDELQYAFAPAFGTHTKEWRDIEMYSAMKRVVAQASSRFTVGLPLCKLSSCNVPNYAETMKVATKDTSGPLRAGCSSTSL